MNLHFGGLVGYSDSKRKGQPRRRCDGWDGEGCGGWVPSGNCISSLNSPPSQIVLSLPGMAQSQRLRSSAPCAVFTGRATKPKGWSLRQFLLRGARQTLRAVQMAGELGGTETYRSSVRRVWQSDMLASVAAGAQPCRARRPTGRGWTRWGLSASRFSVVGRGGDGETRPGILECRGRVKAQSEGSSQTSRGTIHLARNKHRDVGGLRLQLRHLIGRHVGRGSACSLACSARASPWQMRAVTGWRHRTQAHYIAQHSPVYLTHSRVHRLRRRQIAGRSRAREDRHLSRTDGRESSRRRGRHGAGSRRR